MKNKLFVKSVWLLCLALGLVGCINDADVLPEDNSGFVDGGEGNVRFAFVVPNSSSTKAGDAETSGIYETGNANEYNVKSLNVYLFNSDTKALYKKIRLENITRTAGPQLPENSSSGNQNEHVVKYTANRVLIDPGTYDIFTIANGDVTGSFSTENEFINLVDRSTYKDGFGVLTEDGTLQMTNRADNSGLYDGTTDSNLKVTVREILPSEEPDIVTINLERVMAKVLVGQSKEDYSLVDGNGKEYVSISLTGFQYINLSRWFYTFRHTAVLTANNAPSSYTIANGNFGEINAINGFVIDPYFFSKTVDGAKGFDNADSYYAYPLTSVAESWQSVPVDAFHGFYCLENCMFKTAQLNAYSTGVRFKASFVPGTLWGEGKEATSAKPDAIYYANYKFYSSIKAMKDAGLKLDGITEDSTDEELAKFFVKRYRKDPEGNNYYCYYNYWIRHLDNNKENEMGVMEFAIVRNNIYRLLVTNISGLGSGTPEIDPEKPDEYEAYLKMDFNVLPWIVRNQGGDGGATLK